MERAWLASLGEGGAAALPAAAHAGALPVFQAGELAACPLCSASNKAPSRCHGMVCTNTDCKHVIQATAAAAAAPKAAVQHGYDSWCDLLARCISLEYKNVFN